MKRNDAWKILLILSVVFVAVQIYMWFTFSNTDMDEFNQIFLQRFLGMCQKQGLPVFLIDTLTLKQLLSTHPKKKENCYMLCEKSQNYITFGLEGTFLKQKSLLYNSSYPFFTECTRGTSPLHDHTSGKIPLHCWLRSKYNTIHVVLFHNIGENIWWHGSHNKLSKTERNNEMYGAVEGIFKRIATKEVILGAFQLKIPENPREYLIEKTHSEFIPCNRTSAKLFLDRYGQDQTSEAFDFHAKAINLLKRAKTVLDILEVPFWLSSGTCLGWYRQCDIIPYSKDVDIGIFIKDYKVSIVPSMVNAGLELKHKFGKVEDSFELSFQAGDLKLDIFFFYEDDAVMWNGGTQASTGNKYKYEFPKFSLCWTLFFSMLVRVPCETSFYIEANYGKNWRVPVKHWDWKASPPNVKPNGVWPLGERDSVINVYL